MSVGLGFKAFQGCVTSLDVKEHYAPNLYERDSTLANPIIQTARRNIITLQYSLASHQRSASCVVKLGVSHIGPEYGAPKRRLQEVNNVLINGCDRYETLSEWEARP
jgi:hypothetical protein